jgi:hypothetical protein
MRFTIPHALAALLAAGVLAAAAAAQQPAPPPPPPPGPSYSPYQPQPAPTTQTRANVVAAPVQQPPVVVNTAAFAPGYGYYPSNPYGGYLSGAADLVNARANAAVTYQQSRQMSLDYYNATLDTRRAVFNESIYERGQTMNSQQVYEQKQLDLLRRARNDPPLNEIWSADALNALFTDIKKAHTYGLRGPPVPLDPETLKHINLTTGVTVSGPGILKDGPKLRWPSVLRDDRFLATRTVVDDLTAKALEQAKKGQVDLDLIGQARDTLQTMQVVLKQMVKDVSPGPYMDGKRYLGELDQSFVALKSPEVANYFNGKWSAQGATVFDLADYMIKNGLQFAPATAGDQSFYTAFYQSLLSYDLRLSQMASR